MSDPFSIVADSLLSMVPVLVASLLACIAWYVICRFLVRRQDAEWYAALPMLLQSWGLSFCCRPILDWAVNGRFDG